MKTMAPKKHAMTMHGIKSRSIGRPPIGEGNQTVDIESGKRSAGPGWL